MKLTYTWITFILFSIISISTATADECKYLKPYIDLGEQANLCSTYYKYMKNDPVHPKSVVRSGFRLHPSCKYVKKLKPYVTVNIRAAIEAYGDQHKVCVKSNKKIIDTTRNYLETYDEILLEYLSRR